MGGQVSVVLKVLQVMPWAAVVRITVLEAPVPSPFENL